MPRGRPRKTQAEGEMETVEKTKPRSIAVDLELYDVISSTADTLADELGFRPTLSQALSYLIKKANVAPSKAASQPASDGQGTTEQPG